MPDINTGADAVNAALGSVGGVISASGAIGTAAMGLVDASKAVWGGPSRFGFGYIRDALSPFLVQRRDAYLATLQSNWLNGVPKTDQKGMAKSLIRLQLNADTAADFAKMTGVDPEVLRQLAIDVAGGKASSPEAVAVFGRFDASISALIDAAYERGDQKYRNASKLISTLVATALSVSAAAFVYKTESQSVSAYLDTKAFWLSVLIGLSAAPLAPIAKDLTTSLQGAVASIRSLKR